ncbi:helix-turn-helix domain-containing protein [Kitasatospora phosalacinea]|uniref:HTH cro/C1-type domain-containing protein n=1 Tax=Kitasatospora phosalacinea TaxID=2065 RepID=A0A9W6PQ65_9ACTN|nr:helix-turn-helix transcriptional regulator [Kitasatospora phosalacinea]GLW58893.1 hypothetical protein Kpho01_69030 [Kitasatospora phosalacinea]
MTARPSPTEDDAERARIGQRLKDVREYLGLSQQQVAERTGILRSAISDIERGTRRVDGLELKKLAKLFRLSVSYLLDEDNNADAGEHALAGLPHTHEPLTEDDRIEVARFIHYLKARRAAETDSTGRPEGEAGNA